MNDNRKINHLFRLIVEGINISSVEEMERYIVDNDLWEVIGETMSDYGDVEYNVHWLIGHETILKGIQQLKEIFNKILQDTGATPELIYDAVERLYDKDPVNFEYNGERSEEDLEISTRRMSMVWTALFGPNADEAPLYLPNQVSKPPRGSSNRGLKGRGPNTPPRDPEADAGEEWKNA